MANAFTLFGTIKTDTQSFQQSLRDAENRLRQTAKAIDDQEKRARGLGKTNAVTARSYEKLNEKVSQTSNKLNDAAAKFQRGDLTAKQFSAAVDRAGNATNQLNSRLRDSSARLTDFANRSVNVAAKLKAVGSSLSNVGRQMTVGLTAPIIGATYGLLRLAGSFDAMRNKMIAATGSTEAANAKIAELRQLARTSAGVLASSAVELYSFFKPMKLGDETINKLIQSFGRLKMANDDIDISRFGTNLAQLFNQEFERPDLKELVGAFPRGLEILQEAFKLSGSDLKTVSEEMKTKLAQGLSKEDFFATIADAINKDKNLSKLTDTVGIRFQKMMDRIAVALEPLANAVLGAFEPLLPVLVPFIEQLGAAFGQLSPYIQSAVLAIVGVAAAAGPVLIVVGSLITAITTIGTGIAAAVAAVGGAGTAALIVAGAFAQLAIIVGTVAAVGYTLYKVWSTNFGNIQGIVAGFQSMVTDAFNSLVAVVQPAVDAISKYAVEGFQKIHDWWEKNGKEISKAVEAVFTFILRQVQDVLSLIEAFWRSHGDSIKALASNAWNAIKTVVTTVFSVLGNTIKMAAQIINGNWRGAWETFKEIVVDAGLAGIDFLRSLGGMIGNALNAAFQAGLDAIDWVIRAFFDFGANTVDALINGMSSKANQLADKVRQIIGLGSQVAEMGLGGEASGAMGLGIGGGTRAAIGGGSGGGKSGRAGGGSNKKNAAIELLERLQDEAQRVNAVTKEANILLDLQGKEYNKVSAAVKERIILAAREVDNQNALKKSRDDAAQAVQTNAKAMVTFTTKLAEAFAEEQSQVEILAEMTKDMNAVAEAAKLAGMSIENYLHAAIVNAANSDAWRILQRKMELIGAGTVPDFNQTSKVRPLPQGQQVPADSDPTLELSRYEKALLSFKDVANDVSGRITQIFSQAVTDADGFFKGILKGFKEFAKQLIAEMMAVLLVASIVGLIQGLFGGEGFGTGFKAGFKNTVQSDNSQGGSILGGAFGFASGGYTGSGSDFEVAGLVHKNEYVLNASEVRGMGGRSGVERLKSGGSAPINVVMNIQTQDANSFQKSAAQIKRGLIATLQQAQLQGGTA